MRKLLFKLFKNEILSHFTKSDKPNMVFAFMDSDGRRYYSYPKETDLPLDRLKWLRTFYTWLVEGITSGEQGDLLEIAKKENADMVHFLNKNNVLDAAKAAGRVTNVISEIERRRAAIFNNDLLLQYLAVQYIREDETPEVFSPDIQDQKVKQFEKETAVNSSFFFGRPELKPLTSLYRLSEEEWVIAWQKSIEEKILNRKAKEIIDYTQS